MRSVATKHPPYIGRCLGLRPCWNRAIYGEEESRLPRLARLLARPVLILAAGAAAVVKGLVMGREERSPADFQSLDHLYTRTATSGTISHSQGDGNFAVFT